jgi:MFS family permease
VAGAFNGLIAYAVARDLGGVNSWQPWRWLFLIEGVLPMGWAFVVISLLPSTPEHLKVIGRLFSKDEKELIIKRSRLAHNTGESKIRPKLILKLLMDPKFWMLVCIESGNLFCLSSLTNFLPAIIHGFGWSTVKSQLMTVIVYACSFVTIIFWARVSDKTGRRGVFIMTNAGIAAIAYILLLTVKSSSGRFAATCKALQTARWAHCLFSSHNADFPRTMQVSWP